MMRLALVLFLAGFTALAADVTGAWIFDVVTDAGSGSPSFEFKQEGEKVTGNYRGQFGEQKLTGTVQGDKIKFTLKLSPAGEPVDVVYEGTVESAESIKGTVTFPGLGTGKFTGKRK